MEGKLNSPLTFDIFCVMNVVDRKDSREILNQALIKRPVPVSEKLLLSALLYGFLIFHHGIQPDYRIALAFIVFRELLHVFCYFFGIILRFSPDRRNSVTGLLVYLAVLEQHTEIVGVGIKVHITIVAPCPIGI